MNNLFMEKTQLFTNLANHVENKHMPVVSMAQTWAISYAGRTLAECLESLDTEIEIYGKHLLDMNFDGVFIFGVNRPLNAYKDLGFAPYFISPDGVTLQASDSTAIVKEDELDRFIADPSKFLREVAIARRYPELMKDSPTDINALKSALQGVIAFSTANETRFKALKETYKTPALCGGIPTSPPFDQYLCYRGFREALIDVRRNPNKVKEACEAMLPFFMATEEKYPEFPWVMSPVVGATYLSPKQFEDVFWPTYKKVLDSYIDRGAKVLVFMESKWEKEKYAFLNDFKKDSIIAFAEDDEPFEVKKIIGDNCAVGYPFPIELLKNGTKEKVIDHAKSIIDKIGTKGVFLSTDKALMSPGDINPDNYKALCDFCHEYIV